MSVSKEYEEKLKDRYQLQPWYIKLWRLRWYLVIPYWTWKYWGMIWYGYNEETKEWDIPDEEITTLRQAYSIAIGEAQCKMQWYYTWGEVKESL